MLETVSNIVKTSTLVARKAIEVGGRVLTAGRRAYRVSVGASRQGLKSVNEVNEPSINYN